MNIKSTELIFILDRSGSMQNLTDQTIKSFNSFIQSQSEIGPTRLTTILFDDQYEILHDGLDAKSVHLTSETYYTRGRTALLDAIGKTIITKNYEFEHAHLKSDSPEEPLDSVIMVIITDGQENASREFNYAKIHEMISFQKTHHKWEFIFLGANIDVIEECDKLGIDQTASFTYKTTEESLSETYSQLDEYICQSRSR